MQRYTYYTKAVESFMEATRFLTFYHSKVTKTIALIKLLRSSVRVIFKMAHISRPKNHQMSQGINHPPLPNRGNRPGHVVPIPGYTKAAPGYPGPFGPPMPGPDLGGVRASRYMYPNKKKNISEKVFSN